jgi:hypothetical protein
MVVFRSLGVFFLLFGLLSLPLHNRNMSISNPFYYHSNMIASFLQEHFRAFERAVGSYIDIVSTNECIDRCSFSQVGSMII